ncbi:MAG TPA: ABC transporter permease [Candidatus Binatia bacterium]|jgi:peptide/nickel transport system permease protein|nr:ABC transporter permease [Candidatus Binatia bacterium]
MGQYLIQRVILLVPTFVGVTLIGFLVMRLAPGDPAELRAAGGLGGAREGTISRDKLGVLDEALAQWRAQYGLDRPLHVQYAIWVRNFFTLNFGESFKDNQPVWNKILERLPVTIKLNLWSILLVYFVAIPLGIYSATHPNSLSDRATTLAAFVLFAVPLVWAATMAIVFICGGDFYYLFPPGGLESLDYSENWSVWKKMKDHAWHFFLPVVLLSYDGFAGLSRYMRASMLEVLGQDYVMVARAKGLTEGVVVLKHVLRNSLIPLVTILASILPGLIGGSIIVETIFSIPGLGQLGYESVLARDYPTVMGLFTVSAVLTLIGILISDLLLSVVDPRIAFGRRGQ